MILGNLKEQIELHFGKAVALQKDCNELSDKILDKTGLLISSSTLRRFFGFLSTNSQPTRTTLDILCKYVGYENWGNFQQSNSQTDSSVSPMELWNIAKENAQKLSRQFIVNFISCNQINTNKLVYRKFAEDRISHFVQSPFNSTAFIAPRGYGKTSLLIKWYERSLQSKVYDKDIIILVPISELEKCIELDILPDKLLPSILGIPINGVFLNQPDWQFGKILVIIDSLENIDAQHHKLEKLFSSLRQLITDTNANGNVKFIISTRTSIWKNSLCKFCPPEKWLITDEDDFSNDGANFPLLTDTEIQEIFDITIDKKIFVGSFSPELKKTISHPYYLSVFFDIFDSTIPNSFFNSIDLLEAFLKKHIWDNRFSKEKKELVNCILKITRNGLDGYWVKRNDIIERYPINLKLGSNYYTAYTELLSFGIIAEELIENRFGALVRITKLSNPETFSLLIIYKLKEQFGDFTFSIFQQIEKDYASNPLLPNLINTAFQLAYKNRATSALLPIFSLKPETISEALKFPAIPLCLRKDDYMRRDLIPHYCKSHIAQQYLFENNIDIDGIANSFIFNITSYQNAKRSSKSLFLSSNLLSLSGILTLDLSSLGDNRAMYSTNFPPSNCNSLLAGIWFSNRIMGSYFNLFGSIEYVTRDLDNFTSKQYLEFSPNERDTFELGLAFGLILSKNYNLIINRPYPKYITYKSLTPNQKALATFHTFGLIRTDHEINPLHFKRIEDFINDFPEWYNFHPQIIAHSVLSISYLYGSNPEKANDSFQRAVEISKLAGYKLYEIKLLKNLSFFLSKLGEELRAEECENLAKSLANNPAIDYTNL